MEYTDPGKISYADLEELIVWISKIHGFNFQGYARASLKRRVERFLSIFSVSLFELRSLLVNDHSFFETFLSEITVNVTEMFRDPLFFRTLSELVVPYLASFQRPRIWSAGCSTGEEAYALAIVLKQAGILERSLIYGTDINAEVIEKAKSGIFSLAQMRQYSENFAGTGLNGSLSDFYHARYDAAVMGRDLRQNIFFSVHNLVSDHMFNEFQLICCRNVLIYFNFAQQKEVSELLYESLTPLGFLCVGGRETLTGGRMIKNMRQVDKNAGIYQKMA